MHLYILYIYIWQGKLFWKVMVKGLCKLQAVVYGILPSTTAVFSCTIGSRKLSANEQFFVAAQTVVCLLQTTQIISDICFMTDHVAYASSNKTKIVWIEVELFSYLGWMRLMFTCVLWCMVTSAVILVPKPFRKCWQRRWTAAWR